MSHPLKARLADLPSKPGIYFFKNRRGETVYIGKARSLADRIRSYFQSTDDPKIRAILAETVDLDILLTGSEREAAFLENNFIQQYQPRFNLRLKDDKSFPYLRVTVQDRVPGLFSGRKVSADGSRSFGPFSPAIEARKTIRLVTRAFRLRTCGDSVFKGRRRPCLEYDLGQCSGPCLGLITEAAYREAVDNAVLFLEGRTDELAAAVRGAMEKAAGEERFEDAARARDLLATIDQVRIRPQTISVGLEDRDIIGFAQAGRTRAVHVFFMRGGKVRESREHILDEDPSVPASTVLAEFLPAFYLERSPAPAVLLPFLPDDAAGIRSGLSRRAGRSVALSVPMRGRGRTLLELAARNAEILLHKTGDEKVALEELRVILGLSADPVRIDGFDVSNIQGTEIVASLVTFRNGRPWKGGYRKYRIRTTEGPNDVVSLGEAVTRRFSRLLKEGSPLPDLVLVDGGKPQLGSARAALAGLGLATLPLAALAKKEEAVFVGGRREAIRMDRTSPALKLLQNVRDEAHRFAVRFHRERRTKKSFS